MPKITKRIVDGAAPTDKDYVLWDDEMSCFGLRVKPSGAKSYLVQYRNAHGRTRKITVGRHGVLTPDEARSHARLLLAEVARGQDPAENKKQERESLTFGEVADRYMDEHAKMKKKPRSVKEDQRLLDKIILPALRTRPFADVTRADISKLHHAQRGTPYQANRLLSLLSKLFGLGEKWGLRKDGTNPCRHVEKFKERKRERFLDADDLARLGKALSEAEKTELPQAVAAIRLLILTGCRLSEILTLKWDYIDFEQRGIRFPDSKTGRKNIPLSAAAMQVLVDLPRIVGSQYVIFGRTPTQHLIGLPHIWYRIRKNAGLPEVRLHDLRHSHASMAAQCGLSLPLIGALLGHSQPATTARYVHLVNDPLKEAAEKVADRIDEALNASQKEEAKRGEVVSIRQ